MIAEVQFIATFVVFVLLLLVLAELREINLKSKKRVLFNHKIHVTQKGQTMPLELTITNEQKVNIALNPVTQSGKPAKLDGAPKWTVTGGDSTLVVAENGLSADLVSSDTPGDSTFLIDGDADLGAGVVDVQDTILLHVAGANAASLGLVAGTPVLK